MTSEQPEIIPDIDIIPDTSATPPPNFMSDLGYLLLTTIVTVFLWVIFFNYLDFLFALDLIGFVLILVILMFLMPYTFYTIRRWFEIWAYQVVSWRRGLPYMNYKTKCPFLQRSMFTFSCKAEQIAPFDEGIFKKCHIEPMWKACWPERIPSILQIFDDAPSKAKKELAFLLALMKEHAFPASSKMIEVLTNPVYEIEVRVSAGYALAEMKHEGGIEPLIEMVGQYNPRLDQTIRAILVHYSEMAVPSLHAAVQNCESDSQCGGLVEILGKIKDSNSLPILKSLLAQDKVGELTRLQTIYALQEMNSEEAIKILIEYLERAPEEEQTAIKQVCISRNLLSFPILIELLANQEISEDYYARIGDILAEVDARTYDHFFTELSVTQGLTTVQKLAAILKENTPEEEEFRKTHEVLAKHIANTGLNTTDLSV